MEAYFYRNQLNKEARQVYHLLEQGLRNMEPSFPVPRVEERVLEDCFVRLRLDCPELFYAPSYRARFSPQGDHYEVLPRYSYTKKQMQEHARALKARADKLLRPVKEKSAEEQLLFIHDFICRSVTYDKLKKDYSHEITGPLENGVGVCEGIAKSVKYLCDALGIPCVIALSDNNPEKGIKYRHTWNVVKPAGSWLHLDATFDRTLSREELVRYDYFLLPDVYLFRDHEPVICAVPPCTDTKSFYYRSRKLCFSKPEQLESRLEQAARKGKPFAFAWDYGNNRPLSVQEVFRMAEEAGSRFGRHCTLYWNRPQSVVAAVYGDRAEGILEQNADEAEN